MNWQVTYRDKNGHLNKLHVEATSRAALFEELSNRKISAVRIEECEKIKENKYSKNFLIGLLTCVTLICICILLWALLKNKAVEKKAVEKPIVTIPKKQIEKEFPKPISIKKVQAEAISNKRMPSTVGTNFVNNVWYDNKGRPHYKVARTIRPGQNTIINGKPWRPEKPVFHNSVEVELDVLLSRRPGERIFGDVNWRAFKKDLASALASKIEISSEDSAEVIARKEAVIAAKKELLEAIKAGEDPVEILKASRDDINRLADMRDNLQVAIAEMRQEGMSEDEIEDAVTAANEILKKNNIDFPLISPRTMRERGEAAKLRKLKNKQ